MDIFEAIEKRHSYRGPFTDATVSRDDLRKIVSAGLAAPSGCNGQTTEFVIIDDENIVRQINQMHETNKAMQQGKAYIACLINTDPQPVYQGKSFEIEDCSAAVENMLLAITALGYASVWIDGWLRGDKALSIAKLLSIPQTKTTRILLPIGVPAEQSKQPEKKPFEQRAYFNKHQ